MAKKAATKKVTKRKPAKKKVVRSTEPLVFDCVSYTVQGKKIAVFSCSAKLMWSVAEVNKREEGGDGYQRIINEGRATKIAKFIDDGNIIPTSVLISFEHASLSSNGKKLTVKNRADAGWVIDGQHRLRGGYDSEHDTILPVVAILGLSDDEQARFFVTINKEAKGVPTSLYLDLLPKLSQELKKDQQKIRAVDLANTLRNDDQSPFFGKILSTTSPKAGELSLTNFVRKVEPHLRSGGCLAELTLKSQIGVLSNFYRALSHVFPDEYDSPSSVFFRTIGFGALMEALPVVLDITRQSSGAQFFTTNVIKTLKPISDFDFRSWRGRTGSASEKLAAAQLKSELLKANDAEGGLHLEV